MRTSSGHVPITETVKLKCLSGTSDQPCWLAKACDILLQSGSKAREGREGGWLLT